MRDGFKRITQKDWVCLSKRLASLLCLDVAGAGNRVDHHKLLPAYGVKRDLRESSLPSGVGNLLVSGSH